MAENKQLTVRPRTGRTDFKDAFWVYLSSSALVSLKLKTRDFCHIVTPEGLLKTAIVWPAREKIQDNVIQVTDTLRDVYGLSIGDKVNIRPSRGSAPEAANIYVHEDPEDGQSMIHENPADEEDNKSHWEWYLDFPFRRAEFIAVGMKFDVERKERTRRFRIERIEPSRAEDGFQADSSPFKYSTSSIINVMVELEQAMMSGGLQAGPTFTLDRTQIGGLHRQVADINRLLRPFSRESNAPQRPRFSFLKQGLLLYGPKGTGKSLLTSAIKKCPWKRIIEIEATGSPDAAARKVNQAFVDAKAAQPSLIVFSQLEKIAPSSASTYAYQGQSSLTAALVQGFENIRGANICVVGEAKHPNNIDESIRARFRFETEIEVTVPTANERLEILYAIREDWPSPSNDLLQIFSERTHGYVGSDLMSLMGIAADIAEDREYEAQLAAEAEAQAQAEQTLEFSFQQQQQSANVATPDSRDRLPTAKMLEITEDDLSQALNQIRPSALQEIFLSTPHTPWSAIGGYDNIKQQLQNSVSRPLRYPELMSSLNLRSGKGFLMYGPPGCSKTLLVKALATESGLNFLAVKGAEVLSMYVGESERAVREIFRKARAASPSIIFFDEIDSIASTRSGTGSGGSGINVLTTLLNELDGIEELNNVMVVAATNAPQVIDPALLRPGRLDQLLYVGPPDEYARHQILSNWFASSRPSNSLQSDDVLRFLSQRLEGHSGAEIVGICETAATSALDRYDKAERERTTSRRIRFAGTGISPGNGTIARSASVTSSVYSMNMGIPVGNSFSIPNGTAAATATTTPPDFGRMRSQSTYDCRIELDDVERAIQKARKGISPEMLAAFEEFAANGVTSDT